MSAKRRKHRSPQDEPKWRRARLLTQFQRSELALELEPLIAAKAKENEKTPTGNKSGMTLQKSGKSKVDTDRELAKAAGVSHDTIGGFRRG